MLYTKYLDSLIQLDYNRDIETKKMARTHRNIQYANPYARALRHYNYRRNELAALEAILEEFGRSYASNRHASFSSRIADNWDDYAVSAYTEIYGAY